ncbi:MAG TPA: FkbM family methyltransferase [Thermoanaerobaculia bacterium]|jgi:FkbM family methyltransferase|nr:FkbM family methyltransferase [Thermoanaerobaculia bacterium]
MTTKQRLRRALTTLHLAGLYRLWHLLARWDPRRVWREVRFRRWNRGAGPQEMVVRPGLRLRVDARSREPFEWFCFRSVEMTRELDGFVRDMPAHRQFLDVGACHGIFSLAFAHGRPAARALAVEPSAIAYSILSENIRLGGLDNVVASQVACGAAGGTLRMRQTWHHLEALPAAAAAGAGGDDEDGAVAVAMQSVDELCAELDFQPDLVKIDVEGYELAVLAGARATLGRHRPRLFLELHPQRLRELGGSVHEVLDLLAGLGYGFHRPGGAAVSSREIGARESVSRVLCVAGETGETGEAR